MSPALVYRIQDDEGKGPYFSSRVTSPSTLDMSKMPTANCEYEDNGDMTDAFALSRNGRAYAFASREKLHRWVTVMDRQRLSPAFLLHIYMVPPGHMAPGKEQVVFDRDVAVLVAVEPLI